MKNFMKVLASYLSILIFAIGIFGCADSPNAPIEPVYTASVPIKFIATATDEVFGENLLELTFENFDTLHPVQVHVSLRPTSVVLTPTKKFNVYESVVNLPIDIGHEVTYQMKATFLGFPLESSFPSQDVSQFVYVNGSKLSYGNDEGMIFQLGCDGDIYHYPSNGVQGQVIAYGSNVNIYTTNQFSGDVIITADELVLDDDGKTDWRPLPMTYEWATQGDLLTYRYRKVADANHSPSTDLHLRPSSRDRYIRLNVIIQSGTVSQSITNQMSIAAPGAYWHSDEPDGSRIYRVYGSGSGKG